jgi:short subunit dehydrogenase-like uncharacterized protein
MPPRILIYGATGYTGRLVATEAAKRDVNLVLAGRDPERLKAVADPLGADVAAIELGEASRLRVLLDGVDAVLHVAGPFSHTARPMVDACLSTGTHYLDVTGEIDVFEAIARRGGEAEEAGVVLLPGVGFDVVPSDCLAMHTAEKVDEPMRLRLAIAGMAGGLSRGTARTLVESLRDGLRIRRDGILRTRRSGSLEHRFDFGAGPARGLAISGGDVSTAFHSTGIPNVEVHLIASGRVARLVKASPLVGPLLRLGWVQRWVERRIDRLPEGPDEATRRASRTLLLAEVEGPGGQLGRTLLETPNGYDLTQAAAVEAALRVARGGVPAGFQTPATAFGADFVLELPGCRRTELS